MQQTITKNHFGVYAIILKKDHIVLVKKIRGPYKDKLDLPGGRPEHGETIHETLKREVMEETGIDVYQTKLFNNYSTVAIATTQAGIQEQIHHIGAIYLVLSFDYSALMNDMDREDSLGAEWYLIAALTEDQLSPFAYQAIIAMKHSKLAGIK